MPDSRVPRPRRFLVCEPRHFAVQYAINPWMHPDTPVDVDLAQDQWQALIRAYRAHGHTVDTVEPVAGLPDMVFAANSRARPRRPRLRLAASTRPSGAPSPPRTRPGSRRPGSTCYRPESVCEGEGDLVPAGRYILAGTGFRTTREAHREVQEFFGVPVISLQLVDPHFYHLDTALFVLDDGRRPAGTSRTTRRRSRPAAARCSPGSTRTRCSPPARTRMAFGLNSVSDGRHVFIAPRAEALADQLARHGYVPVPVDLSEFHKAGGGIKCCTQEIRS